MVLKEFFVALGLQDNMSSKLDESLKKADQSTTKFASAFAKRFVLAGVAVTTFVATASVGLAKFAMQLDQSDRELETFAKKIRQPKEEAYKTKTALDVMGKSMEEVKLDPKLLEQFKELKTNAASLEMPDLSEGLKPVREFHTSILALKQTAANALQWVGFHFLKYVARPLEDIQKRLKGLNETIQKNIPTWSEKVGKALSWIVQLAGTIIRAGAQMFSVIKKVFDAIPDGVKVAMVALGLLGVFIKSGPIGKLIMIISAVLLLLDDFYTYLDGGDSLLGPVWKTLINIWDTLKEKADILIPVIAGLVSAFGTYAIGVQAAGWAQKFFNKEGGAGAKVIKALSKAFKFFTSPLGIVLIVIGLLVAAFVAFKRSGKSVDEFVSGLKESFGNVIDIIKNVVAGIVEKAPEIMKTIVGAITGVLDAIMPMLPQLLDMGVQLLTFLIDGIISMLPQLLEMVLKLISLILSGLLSALPQIINAGIKILTALIKGIVSVLPMIIDTAISLIMAIVTALLDNLPQIIEMGIQLLLSLIDGIVAVIPQLIQAIVDLIPVVIQALTDNLPKIIEAGIRILIALISGLIKAIPQLIAAIPKIVSAIINGLGAAVTGVGKVGIEIIKGLWAGISSMGDWLGEKVGGLVTGAIDKVKGAFSGGGKKMDKETGHAEGGVFDQEHDARFAEGNKAEAVIPLTKPKRAAEVMREAADYMTGTVPSASQPAGAGVSHTQASGQGAAIDKLVTVAQALTVALTTLSTSLEKAFSSLQTNGSRSDRLDFTALGNQILTFLSNADKVMAQMGQMAQTSVAYNAVSSSNISYNSTSIDNRQNYTIHDTSGSPRTTADMVSRTQALHNRNMKGVFA